EENYLRDVVCTSTSDCWAVGYYGMFGTPDNYLTLIQHWNGSSWSVVDSPNPDPTYNLLFGVTCSSASDCWAVGKFNSGNYRTLTAKWDGTSWGAVVSPNLDLNNSLEAITCLSASNCWASGSKNDGSATLIQNWDGISWSIVASPNLSSNNQLSGIACTAASNCWAVGVSSSAPFQALTARWDGQAWSIFSMSPAVSSVVSRKIHGTAGTFDIDLPQSGPSGIECRFGGLTNDFQLVFTFATELASVGSVMASAGTVNNTSIGPDAHEYIVDLTNVPNAVYLTVTLNTVHDMSGGVGDASSTVRMIIGDVNGNGVVNSADLSQTKARSGQPIDNSTFRSDIKANGSISSSDITLIKLHLGTGLP
ncbi:MAG: dockerin type I repeat-containing protein, partial [Verrucomicrobiota bacterium]